MPRPLEPGKPAKYKYNQVKYAHVETEPGEPAVLTADPWSYLHAFLSQKRDGSHGDRKKCFKRAIYFTELAESFYRAGEAVDLPTKGTLMYYGMMNLVKAYISSCQIELETRWEHHGLIPPTGSKYKVEVKKLSSTSTMIFAEFSKLLGTPISAKQDVDIFKDVCSHIPELHEIAFNLKFVSKRNFLPVEIDFLVNDTNEYLFTEIRYDKKHELRIPTNKFLQAQRRTYFKEGCPREGWVVYRSKRRKKITSDSWPRIYSNIIREYKAFNIASILGRSGYRYYIDLSPGDYHHLSYTLMMLFYIGSIARYRPSEMQEIMSGNYRSLITEAVAICPSQFLYQITTLTTQRICVVPYAML
jgi:hypothetical protein